MLTATRDSRAETVLDLLPPELKRRDLFPAGRLDKDTTGLLVLTNDGEYAHRMLAPKSHVWKRYRATLDLPAEESDIARFAAGIKSGENEFAPAVLEISKDDPHIAWTEIREGKFHQSSVCFSVRQDRHGPSPRIHRRFNARSHTYARRSENSRSERRCVWFLKNLHK